MKSLNITVPGTCLCFKNYYNPVKSGTNVRCALDSPKEDTWVNIKECKAGHSQSLYKCHEAMDGTHDKGSNGWRTHKNTHLKLTLAETTYISKVYIQTGHKLSPGNRLRSFRLRAHVGGKGWTVPTNMRVFSWGPEEVGTVDSEGNIWMTTIKQRFWIEFDPIDAIEVVLNVFPKKMISVNEIVLTKAGKMSNCPSLYLPLLIFQPVLGDSLVR